MAVWLLSLAMIGIRDRDVPVLLGLLSVVMLVLAVCGIAAASIRDRGAARCFGGVLTIATTGWLLVMSVYLFRGA